MVLALVLRRPRGLRALVAVQLAALVVLGAGAANRHYVFSGDERPHFDYVQTLVEERRIPRPTDLTSPESLAIQQGSWPRPYPGPTEPLGLSARSFEAIQPPLFYLVAAPAFAIPVDHLAKVRVLRLLDLALVLLALWLLWRLARRVGPERAALPAFALAMTVVLWPGVVVRGVTISNTPLELVVVTAFLAVLWQADRAPGRRPLALAALLLGLCLLTKLSLQYLVPLFALVLARRVRRDRTWRSAAVAVGLLVLPLLVLGPWLALNVVRYGSPTVDILGQPQIVELSRPQSGAPPPLPPPDSLPPPVRGATASERLSALPDLNARLLDGVVPGEWEHHLKRTWIRVATAGLLGALLLALIALAAARAGGWRLVFLALPVLSGLLLMNVVAVASGDDAVHLRYLYPALPALALGIGLALHDTAAGRRLLVPGTAVLTVLVGAVWVWLAGSYYFVDAGSLLGIPIGGQ